MSAAACGRCAARRLRRQGTPGRGEGCLAGRLHAGTPMHLQTCRAGRPAPAGSPGSPVPTTLLLRVKRADKPLHAPWGSACASVPPPLINNRPADNMVWAADQIGFWENGQPNSVRSRSDFSPGATTEPAAAPLLSSLATVIECVCVVLISARSHMPLNRLSHSWRASQPRALHARIRVQRMAAREPTAAEVAEHIQRLTAQADQAHHAAQQLNKDGKFDGEPIGACRAAGSLQRPTNCQDWRPQQKCGPMRRAAAPTPALQRPKHSTRAWPGWRTMRCSCPKAQDAPAASWAQQLQPVAAPLPAPSPSPSCTRACTDLAAAGRQPTRPAVQPCAGPRALSMVQRSAMQPPWACSGYTTWTC